MKIILSIILASMLTACAIRPVQPEYVSVNAPCYSTILRAATSGDDSKMGGMGVAAASALGQAGFEKVNSKLLKELGETCARNPELSFIQAATALMNKHSI